MAVNKKEKADIVAVAKAARVSPSTVSRSFNHPDLVKASTRKKIDTAVRRLGYIRNRAAQTIHGIRSGTIGLIVPTIDHAIFAELVQSFSDAVDRLGFTILLASHGYDLQREYALARKMLEHRVDGLALVGLEHAGDTYDLIRQQSTPAVLLWNYSETSDLPCVGADNFRAGHLIADHVVSLGHSSVALVFPPLAGNDRAEQRFAGVSAALTAAGVEVPPDHIIETPYSVADAKSAASRILNRPAQPTAIICGNDVLAWGVLNAARQAKLTVPEALTVTGIGDFKGSKELEPALTTVRIPARQIGEAAAIAIAKSITEPGTPAKGRQIPPELIIRDTSGGLPPSNW